MLYRKVKKNGDALSILGFGCMRLPQKFGRIEEKRAINQIRHAIDKGVNYIDTAMPYHLGASETLLSRALSDGYRERVRLATKLTDIYVQTRDDMDKILNIQRGKLKSEQIDYYLLHGLDRKSWNKMKELGVLDFLEKAKAQGRIRFAGFSFHGDKDVFKEIVDAYDWEICLIQYNFLDEHNQAGTQGLKYAASKGLGVAVMEPLRGGNLAGKIPASVKAIWEEAPKKRSPAEWALRWVWNRPEVTVVLSGMNREDHLEENLRIAGEARPESLSRKELQLVSRVAEEYKRLTKVGCTGCGYCMPCPAGVNIPSCFEIYNNRYLFNDTGLTKFLYLARQGDPFRIGKPAYASLCEKCGQCEEACPQNLPIQTHLEEVAKEFEDRTLKALGWILPKATAFHRKRTLRKADKKEK